MQRCTIERIKEGDHREMNSPKHPKSSAAVNTFSFTFLIINVYYLAESCFYLIAVSTFIKGEQMTHVLNECGTHCAVYGNHDFGNHDQVAVSS